MVLDYNNLNIFQFFKAIIMKIVILVVLEQYLQLVKLILSILKMNSTWIMAILMVKKLININFK